VVHPGHGIEAVRNSDRGSVARGAAGVVGSRTLVIPLRRGLRGAYSVRWAIVSDDGHRESGVLAFAVGAGTPRPTSVLAPEAAAPREPRAWRAALVVAPGLAVVPAVAGHALDPRLNRVNVVVDVVHVAAASAWVGALVGLLVVRRVPDRRSAALAMGGVAVLA